MSKIKGQVKIDGILNESSFQYVGYVHVRIVRNERTRENFSFRRDYNIIDAMPGETLRGETYVLSVVYASLQGGLISLSPRERRTKWIIKKAVFRLNASLPDKAIKFSTIQV